MLLLYLVLYCFIECHSGIWYQVNSHHRSHIHTYTCHVFQTTAVTILLFSCLTLAGREADSDGVKPSAFSLLEVCEWIDCLCVASNEVLYIFKCMHDKNYTYSANLQFWFFIVQCVCLYVLAEFKYRAASEGVQGGREGSWSSGEGCSHTAGPRWFSNHWLCLHAGRQSTCPSLM